jgi:hypothetical protein
MQQRQQREVAGAVVFVLARVAFTLKVDNSVQRPQRRQWMPLQSSLQRIQRRLRSRQFRLHSVVAQDVRELRSLPGQRVSVMEVVHLPGLEVTPLLSTLTSGVLQLDRSRPSDLLRSLGGSHLSGILGRQRVSTLLCTRTSIGPMSTAGLLSDLRESVDWRP